MNVIFSLDNEIVHRQTKQKKILSHLNSGAVHLLAIFYFIYTETRMYSVYFRVEMCDLPCSSADFNQI